MFKRLTAFLLTAMLIFSSIPLTASAVGANVDINAGGGGNSGGGGNGSGGGFMSYDKTGYRFYLATEDGKRVSRVVDLIYTQGGGSSYWETTKLDNGQKLGSGEYACMSIAGTISAINASLASNPDTKGTRFSVPDYPIQWVGDHYIGKGINFRSWIMGGLDTTLGTGVDVDFSGGYELKPSKGQGFPPDKGSEPITSTDVYSTLEDIALNYIDTLYQFPHPEYNMSQYSAKAASGSTLQHLRNFINETAAQNSLTDKQMQVYRAAVLLVYDNVVLPAVEDYPVATESSYGWYSDDVKEVIENDSNNSVEIEGNAGGGSGIAGSGSSTVDSDGGSKDSEESLLGLPVAFAAEEANGQKLVDPMSIPLGNILALAYANGTKLLFDTTAYGIDLVKDSDGVYSMIETASANNLHLLVEPVFWLTPAHWSYNNDTFCSGHGVSFYGTPTNYARWAMEAYPSDKADGWDGYCGVYGTAVESNHKTAIGNALAQTMVLQTQFANMSAPTLKTGDKSYWPNSDLQNKNLGLAIHDYSLKIPSGTPTQHTWNGDPEPDEVPDPDDIPVEQGEPTEPGDPITPEQWYDPENNPLGDPTRSNTTRTIKIVKVYQFEDEYGNLYHEVTYHTDGNPGTIAIQNEPGYKVAEYFTSPDYYEWVDLAVGEDGKFIKNGDAYTRNDGTSSAITPDTPWSSFYNPSLIEIPTGKDPDLYYRNIQAELEGQEVNGMTAWDALFTDTTGGDVVDNITIGIAADPENKLDPKPKTYGDIVLYIRLVHKEEEPSTHTHDPDVPDEGPAPEPEDPDNPDNAQYLHYRIVKVYEKEDGNTGEIEHITTTTRYPTYPIIVIEDEPKYDVIEWKYGNPYEDVYESSEWDSPEISNVVPDNSGTEPTVVNITAKDDDEKEVTLYVRLRYSEKNKEEDVEKDYLTESQLTKLSGTNRKSEWSGYTFKTDIPALSPKTQQHTKSYTDSNGYSHTYTIKCSLSRTRDDQHVYEIFTYTGNSLETTTDTGNEFDGKLFNNGALSETVKFDEPAVGDGAWTQTIGSNGRSPMGLEYLTTLSRHKIGDTPTLAAYKKSNMDGSSYNRVSSVYPVGSTPQASRLANNHSGVSTNISYTFKHSSVDKNVNAICDYDGSHSKSDTAIYTWTPGASGSVGGGPTLTLSSPFKVQIYRGLKAKEAKDAPKEMNGYNVTHGSYTSKPNNGHLYVCEQGSDVQFYPYIKMSYQITMDGVTEYKNYKLEPYKSNARTVYMLSEYKSTILPTDTVEVSYNKSEGYNLNMTSQQWSVHSKATSSSLNEGGETDWHYKNQVLPGGALYQLDTSETNGWISTTTYSTLVADESRIWIDTADDEYTAASVYQNNHDYIEQLKESIDNLRVVQWVQPSVQGENAWSGAGATKVMLGGESLSNLTKAGHNAASTASTDSKYRLTDGTTDQKNGASEGDIDIISETYTTNIYKVFTDVNGNVYIGTLSLASSKKETTAAEIQSAVSKFEGLNGAMDVASKASSLGITATQIGTQQDSVDTIISKLKNNNPQMYALDQKTKLITNSIKSVERNTGDDTENGVWGKGGKWYNEAFDGIYVVEQTSTFSMGLAIPSKRVSVLDPNLCPSKTSTSDVYSTAFLSQFCLDSKSSLHRDEADGYVGEFKGTKVMIDDIAHLFYSRPFYIPNANVQDLT